MNAFALARPGRYLLIAAMFLGLVAASGGSGEVGSVEAALNAAEQTMMVDPARVVPIARESHRRLEAAPPGRRTVLASIRARWLEGEALGRLNEIGAADARTAEALREIERVEPNGQLHGRILMSRGAVELDRGKVQTAFLSYRRAYEIFRRVGDARNQALALQDIGSIYSDAGDQQSVLRYYAQSAELYPADVGLAVAARNNIGLAYKETGDFQRAEREFRKAFALALKLNSPLLEARILNNIGSVQLARGQLAAADRSAGRALKLALDGGAADWAPFVWGLKAQVAFARGDARTAVSLFERAFAGEDLTSTSIYFRDFHQAAVDAYTASGDEATALRHLRAFKRLDDEARAIRSSTNAALNAAQFDFSNQELKISKLQAGQLQRDVAIERARTRLQTLILTAALLLLAVTLAGFFSVRHSRNQTRAANKQLESSNRSLDKALKAKSEFLATTSHEIRTPLNGILGMAQVLLGGRTLAADDRERVGLISAAGTTMKAIVDDILDMAKIESGRVEVHRAPLDLPAVLTEVGALWRAEAESKGVALTLDLAAAPPRIDGDERKIRQIVFNLVSNAVKFTEQGSVALAVEIATGETGEELRICVRDTGVGIPPDQIDAVFEAFHQVEGGTTRKVGGTGLGLAICANLARALGGRVSATSAPGKGSAFTLVLPLELSETPVTAARAVDDVPRDLADASVLMVEGNALFQSIFAASLEGQVGGLELAASLAEAAARMETLPPDLLIVDLATMADERPGSAALRRWLGEHPHPRLLLLSGPDESDATALVADGVAAAFLRKTLPPVGLAAALAALLGDAPQSVRAAA